MRPSAPAGDPLPAMAIMAVAVMVHIIASVRSGDIDSLFIDATAIAAVIAMGHALLRLYRGPSRR